MVSVDPLETNKAFAEQEEANFPFLSDESTEVAKTYGVLSERGMANRWMFFIGTDGTILHIEKTSHTRDAGEFLSTKLAELGVARK